MNGFEVIEEGPPFLFFGVVARLRHETDCIFSPFGDDVDARRRSSFSFPELR